MTTRPQSASAQAFGAPVVIRPARWRTLVSSIVLGAAAAFVLVTAIVLPNHLALGALFVSSILCLPMIWYSAFMTSAVTVRPGVSIERRRPINGVQTVPIDSTTEIVAYLNPNLRSWFVIRTQGRSVMRLSDQYWPVGVITELARTAPAALRLRTAKTTRAQIVAEYPDYFSPLEEKYGWTVFVMILLSLPFIVGTIAVVAALVLT